jgi:hypothetical protein
MGAFLREFLATRTVVFIGYSLRDWNFRRLYSALRADLAKFAPRAYAVTPFGSEEQFEDFDLQIIKTSGTKFLEELKAALVGSCFIDDCVYDTVDEFFDTVDRVDEIAKGVSHKEFPAIIHCWAYHDGMRDACFRILKRRANGEYSNRNHVRHLMDFYDKEFDELCDAGRFTDAAYLDGYNNVLFALMSDFEDAKRIFDDTPLYFIYGADTPMRTEDELLEALQHSRRRSPKTRKEARSISDALPEGMVRSHMVLMPDFSTDQTC